MAFRSKYWETVPGQYPESPSRERMTAEGVDYMIKNKAPPPNDGVQYDDSVAALMARADSEPQRDGMLKTTVLCPETGRKTYEFTSLTGRKTWMDAFKPELQEMLFINNKGLDELGRKALKNKLLADREYRNQISRDLAAGKDVRFADFTSGERVS